MNTKSDLEFMRRSHTPFGRGVRERNEPFGAVLVKTAKSFSGTRTRYYDARPDLSRQAGLIHQILRRNRNRPIGIYNVFKL